MSQNVPNRPQQPGQSTPMTPEAAKRIQSAEAKSRGGEVSKDDFAARAARAAARNDDGKGGGNKK